MWNRKQFITKILEKEADCGSNNVNYYWPDAADMFEYKGKPPTNSCKSQIHYLLLLSVVWLKYLDQQYER